MASYFLGIDANPNTMILFWVALITFFNISDQKSESLEFGKYGLLGLMFVLFALVWADKNGGIQILYGRLALGDNIRSLANATAISEILLGFSFFDSKKAKGKFLKIFFLLFGVVVLLLTFSKGALISSGVTLLLLLMRSNISLSKKFLIVLLVAAALIVTMNYVSTGDEFRSDRLSDGIDGFSGRTDIWSAYWQAMKEKISTLLFGFGPGDIKRLGVVTSYSHSLIFDVLFSYGVCGFSVFIGLLLNSVYRCLKSKNKLAIVMSVFPLLLFSTHSTATDVRFYILFGMAVALSVNKNIGMN